MNGRLIYLFFLAALLPSASVPQPSATMLTLAAGKTTISFPGNGAACDGTSDDAEPMNRAMATLVRGGTVYIAAGFFCFVNSSNLHVPPNVRVQGLASPNGTNPQYTSGSGFSVNPAFTIELNRGTALENVVVKRAALLPDPQPNQVIDAVARWGNELSVGLTIPANVAGVTIEHLFVIGFNTCIKSSSGAFSISHVWGDCYNGIEVSHAGDNHYIDDVRFEPIYGLNVSPTTGAWARPGIAFHLHDGNTGGVLTRVFSFMFASGVLMNDIGVTQIANSGWEWQPSMSKNVGETVGVRWINHNAQTSVSNSYVNGFGTSFSDEGTGEVVIATPSLGGASVAGFYLGGVSASPAAMTILGRAVAGDKAILKVTSSAVIGSPIELSYTIRADDTGGEIAKNLANLVNRNQALIAARFSAAASRDAVVVFWPIRSTASVSWSDRLGSMRAEAKTAPIQSGSYGAIYAPNVDIGQISTFALGSRVNRWLIDAPYETTYKGWISFQDESDTASLTLRGISYAKSEASGLSNCGLNPSLDGRGTDEASTITEGAEAIGCTYTFAVPFPKSPFCMVSSPTGSPIRGFSVSATALVIDNPPASHAKFTFRCDP